MYWLLSWFLTTLASLVVGELLAPRQEINNAKALGAGDFKFPTADPSRCIPLLLGKGILQAPNVVWYGDFSKVPIRKRAGKGGFLGMGHTKWQTVGYRYFFGQHLALCWGPIQLLEIRAQDQILWSAGSTGGTILIDNDASFGGEDGGGGWSAKINFLAGDGTELEDPYLQKRLGNAIPAYRGIACLVVYGPSASMPTTYVDSVSGQTLPTIKPSGYVGTSQYIKPTVTVAKRIPNALGLTGLLLENANPAECIYLIATNPDFGESLADSDINLASLKAAGQQLVSEGFYISLLVDTARPCSDIIEEICKTIDGIWFLNFVTGLYELRLARFDYDPNTLEVFDETDILELQDFGRAAIDETVNQVTVNFTDQASNFQTRPAIAKNSANIRIQGVTVAQTLSYPMIPSASTASKVAMRDLRAYSTPLARFTLKVNRSAYTKLPGDVIKLAWSPLGIEGLITRIVSVGYGELANGVITLKCVQDIFSLSSSAYADPSPSGWSDPITNPVPVANQQLFEAPYIFTGSDDPQLLTVASRATGSCFAYDIRIKTQGSTEPWASQGTGGAFTPEGTLVNPYPASTAANDLSSTLIIQSGHDLSYLNAAAALSDLRGGANLAYFATGEIIAFTYVTDNGDGTFTLNGVWRGLLDTFPVDHAAGERVWFAAYGQGLAEPFYNIGDQVDVRLLPTTPRGTLDISAATSMTWTFSGRAAKPYPPANLQVNGLSWPVNTIADAVATWSHRNRLDQAQVIPQTDPSASAPEGTYTINVYVGGVLKQTLAGSTAATYTYTAAQRLADDTDGTKTVQIGITAVSGTLSQAERRTSAYTMTGFGMTFGLYFGGIQA